MTPQNKLDGLFFRKLYANDDDIFFKLILRYNLRQLPEWKKVYPNHGVWINKVIEELIQDTNDRVAFGGFSYDKDEHEWKLRCSVIIKKNPFAPYLEIKNFIVLNSEIGNDLNEYRKQFQSEMIQYLQKFARLRGYPKLVIEVFNRNKNDKDLIHLFIENDFVITGNRLDKYKDSDEVLFLSCEINQVYSYDPYDFRSISSWITGKYLGNEMLESAKNPFAIIKGDNNKIISPNCYIFDSGKKFTEEVTSKFNFKVQLIILEEHFKTYHKLKRITELTLQNTNPSRTFLFDFSKEFLTNAISIDKNVTTFNRDELEMLLSVRNEIPFTNRCDYEDIGGLLLISNPSRFDDIKANNLLSRGTQFIYIKLGEYGKYLEEDMPLVLAYYDNLTNRSQLKIWGIAYLAKHPKDINLLKLREENNESMEESKLYSDGQFFFDYLKNIQDEDINEVPLWDYTDFDKHNKYNATNRIVYYTINRFINLKDDKRTELKLKEFIGKEEALLVNQNAFDFYLTKTEVTKLTNLIKISDSFDENKPYKEGF